VLTLNCELVRLRSIKPNIPNYHRRWTEARAAQEASRQATLKDRAPR
jgi:hypothetical protein